MTASNGIAGLVLAGGRARRMGGGDKPLIELGGEPMLARILRRLAPQVEAMALSANGDPSRFAGFGLPVLRDAGPWGEAGPLAGIAAGLAWCARATTCSRMLSVAGDTPFFPNDLVQKLLKASGDPESIAVASSSGRLHPTFALWPVSIADDLSAFLTQGRDYSVVTFLERHRVVTVDFETDGGTDPFFNINTPDDLRQAEAVIAELPA